MAEMVHEAAIGACPTQRAGRRSVAPSDLRLCLALKLTSPLLFARRGMNVLKCRRILEVGGCQDGAN